MDFEESSPDMEESNIVDIGGRLYNRLLAHEMAQDIDLLTEIAPRSWSLQDNSAIRVMRSVALSFAEPVGHGYLVEPSVLGETGQSYVAAYGVSAQSKPYPSFVNVHLPSWTVEVLTALRPGHEAALRRLVKDSNGIAPAWKYLNLGRLEDLEAVVRSGVGRPGYFDQWKSWRMSESESTDLSSGGQPGNPDELLQYVADGIETAHEVNPNSWSIYNVKGGSRSALVATTFSISQTNAATLHLLAQQTSRAIETLPASQEPRKPAALSFDYFCHDVQICVIFWNVTTSHF